MMSTVKKLFVLLLLLAAFNVNAQVDEKKNWPKIEFENLEYDFGEIAYNSEGNYDFVFKNVGKGPLIIKKVQSS